MQHKSQKFASPAAAVSRLLPEGFPGRRPRWSGEEKFFLKSRQIRFFVGTLIYT
jgi:hypothetical protein